MARTVLIKPVKLNAFTPVRNITNRAAKTCLLDEEIGFIDLGDGSTAVIVGSSTVADRHFVVGPPIIPHTFTMEGDVAVKTLPGFWPVYTLTGNTNYPRKARLLSATYKTAAGNATVQVRRNGTMIGSAIGVGSASAATTNLDTNLASGDYLDINITAASSATNLSVTLHIMYY